MEKREGYIDVQSDKGRIRQLEKVEEVVEILFRDKSDTAHYKLLKRDPGWELMKYEDGGVIEKGPKAGDTKKAGWRKMAAGNGLYPHDMEHAVVLIAEDQMTCSTGSRVNIAENTRWVVDYLNSLHAVSSRFTTEAAA